MINKTKLVTIVSVLCIACLDGNRIGSKQLADFSGDVEYPAPKVIAAHKSSGRYSINSIDKSIKEEVLTNVVPPDYEQ